MRQSIYFCFYACADWFRFSKVAALKLERGLGHSAIFQLVSFRLKNFGKTSVCFVNSGVNFAFATSFQVPAQHNDLSFLDSWLGCFIGALFSFRTIWGIDVKVQNLRGISFNLLNMAC